jgi:hypothetical protein
MRHGKHKTRTAVIEPAECIPIKVSITTKTIILISTTITVVNTAVNTAVPIKATEHF